MHSSVKDSNKNAPALFMQRSVIPWSMDIAYWWLHTLSLSPCVYECVCSVVYVWQIIAVGCSFATPSLSFVRLAIAWVYFKSFEWSLAPFTHSHRQTPFLWRLLLLLLPIFWFPMLLQFNSKSVKHSFALRTFPYNFWWGFFNVAVDVIAFNLK